MNDSRLTGRRSRFDRWVILGLFLLSAAVYLIFMDLPIFSDAYGYGYRSARWIADNGMQFFPSGESRGEQAMGHFPLFYWIWALFLLVADSVRVAHILPAAGAFLALWGTYRLAYHLCVDRKVAVLAALSLLATPIFLANSITPLPDTLFAAAIVWSVLMYARDRPGAAAAFATGALFCREQGALLVGVFLFVELVHGGWRRPLRLALLAAPLLVLPAQWLGNLIANGYLISGNYVGEATSLPQGWLADRLRLFGGHMFGAEYRWLPITVAAALLATGNGRRRVTISALLILLSPALIYPPGRLAWLAVMALALGILLLRRRRLPGRITAIAIVLPMAFVLFHSLIVMVTPDPALDLLRYTLGALPVLLAVLLSAIARWGGRRTAIAIGAVFVVATFSTNRHSPYPRQAESTLNGVRVPLLRREAIRLAADKADTVLIGEPYVEQLSDPAIGYVESSVPGGSLANAHDGLDPGADYSLVFLGDSRQHEGVRQSLLELNAATHSIRIDTVLRSGPFQTEVVVLRGKRSGP